LADADHDGLVNLLEYAFDTDPATKSALSDVLNAVLVEEAGTDYLALRFRRRICRDFLIYKVEIGSGLGSWQSGPAHTLAMTPPIDNGDGTETVTVRSMFPRAARLQDFMRLEVTYIGP
jgi:hypothetical protein